MSVLNTLSYGYESWEFTAPGLWELAAPEWIKVEDESLGSELLACGETSVLGKRKRELRVVKSEDDLLEPFRKKTCTGRASAPSAASCVTESSDEDLRLIWGTWGIPLAQEHAADKGVAWIELRLMELVHADEARKIFPQYWLRDQLNAYRDAQGICLRSGRLRDDNQKQSEKILHALWNRAIGELTAQPKEWVATTLKEELQQRNPDIEFPINWVRKKWDEHSFSSRINTKNRV
jgi:hypothetical protein